MSDGAGHRPTGAAGWIGLCLAGQLATLLIWRAGPSVGYQHYPPLDRLSAEAPPLALALLLLQALVVGWGLMGHRTAAGRVLAGASRIRLAMVVLAFVGTSAALSRSVTAYAGELLFASLVQLLQLGNVYLVAISLPERWLQAERVLGGILGSRDAEHPVAGAPDRFVWILALWVTGTSLLLALLSYQGHPHVPDEMVYLLQARYFAEGRMALPLPPVPSAFDIDLMMSQATRWFSPVNPGWPAILALGALVGAPWLVNPILGGVNLVLAYLVLREIYPRRTARITVALFAASPWNLFMAMNFMTHTATLTCALAAAAAVARLGRDPRARWGVLAGCFTGMVALIRPLEGAAVALLLGLWSLRARGLRFRFTPSLALTLAAVVTGALVLPYNRYLTGSARVFPIMAYTDAVYGPGRNDLGFGTNRGLGWPGLDPLPGHGAADVVINGNLNLFQINIELLGWATGSLFLLLLWLGFGSLRRPDRLMITAIAVVAGIHSFYYFSGGPDFGARYWYLAIIPCLALTARGLEFLEDRADRAAPGGGQRVLVSASVLVAGALLLFVPWRAIDKYHHYRGMRPDIRRMTREYPIGNGVMLVQGRRHPDYASAAAYNPTDLTASVPLFAWDRGLVVRRALVAVYPDRAFWIVRGPTVTGRGYEIVAGPLSGAQLLTRADTLASAP